MQESFIYRTQGEEFRVVREAEDAVSITLDDTVWYLKVNPSDDAEQLDFARFFYLTKPPVGNWMPLQRRRYFTAIVPVDPYHSARKPIRELDGQLSLPAALEELCRQMLEELKPSDKSRREEVVEQMQADLVHLQRQSFGWL